MQLLHLLIPYFGFQRVTLAKVYGIYNEWECNLLGDCIIDWFSEDGGDPEEAVRLLF
jgi:hypothetical protein